MWKPETLPARASARWPTGERRRMTRLRAWSLTVPGVVMRCTG